MLWQDASLFVSESWLDPISQLVPSPLTGCCIVCQLAKSPSTCDWMGATPGRRSASERELGRQRCEGDEVTRKVTNLQQRGCSTGSHWAFPSPDNRCSWMSPSLDYRPNRR